MLLFFLTGCGLCDCENDDLTSIKVSKKDHKEMVLVPAGEFIMGTNMVDTEGTNKKIGAVCRKCKKKRN